MTQRTLLKRASYWFDCMMSKGPVAMCVLLFAATLVVIGIVGIAGYLASGEGSVLFQFWSSLMYTLDAGNLAGVPTDNIIYLFLMLLATLCGLFLTSILIGIITTGVEGKLADLQKGTSVVQEDNHTVIIGFNNNVFSIVRELVEANANKRHACIIVLGEQPKEEIEEAIASRVPHTGTVKVICRSGKLHEAFVLERCSVETCKSVIINVEDDAETVKILLALAAYVKHKELTNPDLRFVASLDDPQYTEAAQIAGEGRAAIIFAKDAIARIISNTCRQHGLSQVLTDLFGFSGNELYFESVPALRGKTFREAVLSFSNAVVMGLYTQGRVALNPPMDTVIGTDDQVVLLELDDGAFSYHPARVVDAPEIIVSGSADAKVSDNLLVLGSNAQLPAILEEYAKYMDTDTRVLIVDEDFDEARMGAYGHLQISICRCTVTRDLLCGFLNEGFNNILLLNDDSQDPETSDSQTLLRLILLRDIADKNGIRFATTTEMCHVQNQRLATQTRVDDFVIGSNFTSLLLAQISENPKLTPLVDDLLDESGSELYMKPAADYVVSGVEVDSYILTESAARKGEIYLGYRHAAGSEADVVVNPDKGEVIVFGEGDQVVVIAEH